MMSSYADGQLIRIFDNGAGSVNIRVPFVRVNVDPVYGTQVRAPLVRVNSPPQYYYPRQPYPGRGMAPAYPAQAYPGQMAPGGNAPQPAPGVGQPSIVPPANARPTQPPPVRATQPSPPTEPNRAPSNTNAVQPVAGTEPASRQPTIVSPGSSSDANNPPDPGLRSVLTSEMPATALPLTIGQQRQALQASSEALDEQLSRYSNANAWQKYLQLPSLVYDGTHDESVTPVMAPADMQALRKMKARYDKASAREDYRLVNGLSHFKETHQNLRAFVQMLENSPAANLEELPSPVTEKK